MLGNAKRLFKLFCISSRGILRKTQECSELFDCRHFCILETVTMVTGSLRERNNFGSYKLGEFVHFKYKVTFTIAFYFRTNVKYILYVSTTLSCGNSVNNLDCRASGLFETFPCSPIILQIYCKHKLGEFVHNKSTIIFPIPWNFSLNLKEAFCRNSINIFNCRRCKRKFSKCQTHANFVVRPTGPSSDISSSCK